MIGYETAPSEVMTVIDKVMLLHHKDLVDAGVTLSVTMVHKYDKDDELVPAMMVRGHVCLAKTSITSHADRARGVPDAKMVIDAEWGWARLSEGRREALVHDCLLRFQVQTEEQEDGEVTIQRPKLDDCGRPKLKLRHPDIHIVGFSDTLEKYGESAPVAREITLFVEKHGQYALFEMPGTKKVTVKHGHA